VRPLESIINIVKGKVHPIKVHEGDRGIALNGGGGSRLRPGRFTPGTDQVPIAQEAGWASGPVWTGAQNLVTTGIRSPDRPARSKISFLF
jgi:hypothetical protein